MWRRNRNCEGIRSAWCACAVAVLSALLCARAMAAAATAAPAPDGADAMSTLKQLSLEQLQNVQVTSVSKSPEPLSDAPGSIYVITRDEILRSGARSLPEMLRLAPNLQVAQITSDFFAITARGFNGPTASKLLVLIDGRSVYTPYHSTVSWDVQDVPPESIERIEVISGPGATLWGANAVNGVINIITRSSADTQGGSVHLGGGNLEQTGSVQYGGRLSDSASYRLYIDSFHDNDDVTASGTNANDAWHRSQGGFRLDWAPTADLITVQGDLYGGSENDGSLPHEATSGGNLLARWNHALPGGSGLRVQSYYDYEGFALPGVGSEYLGTYDLDVQHSFSIGPIHSIVWGGGVRVAGDDFPTVLSNTQRLYFSPQRRNLTYSNIFLQDSISLAERLKLVLGMKLEDDPYTGLAPLPSLRVSWKFADSNLLWGAISRAVRAPSRIDRDLYEVLGPITYLRGGDFQPEELTAYELGYRAQPSPKLSVSVSTFYNDYTDLRSIEPSPGYQLPLMFANLMAGHTDGVEAWGDYAILAWWRLAAGANWLHEALHFEPASSGIGGLALAGDDPSYQLSLRSSMDIGRHWQLEIDLRRVGALPDPVSPPYTEADTRIAWAVSPTLDLSLVGANLLHPHHLEFGSTASAVQLGPTGVEIGRSVFAGVHWSFR